jgi:hypothetical protein
MWNDLPKNYTHIDAVYERGDKKIVFFIGVFVYDLWENIYVFLSIAVCLFLGQG